MAIKLADMNGNSYIGVFCKQIGDLALCPMETTDEFMSILKEGIGVDGLRTSAGNTNLHGSLIASNSNGMIIPYFYHKKEILNTLRSSGREDLDIRVEISEDPHTAWGNNVLMSKDKALVNPELTKESLELIAETFDVEVIRGTIAGINTIGSIAVLNSKGMVTHPKSSQEDIDRLKDLFKVDVYISTVNFGSPYLGASIIANDMGALVGSQSSGVELNRIENSLDIID